MEKEFLYRIKAPPGMVACAALFFAAYKALESCVALCRRAEALLAPFHTAAWSFSVF
jgi:hypothetical protein